MFNFSIMMKKWMFLLMIFVSLFVYIALFWNGRFDFYYKKVSGSRVNSIICGQSRAFQGIVPSVLNDELKLTGEKGFLNFAFSAIYSPYDSVYFDAIKKKLMLTNKSDGIAIFSVNPRSISIEEDESDDDYTSKSFLKDLDRFSGSVNFDYILNSPETFHKKLFLNYIRNKAISHDDGWLEVRIEKDAKLSEAELNRKLNDPCYEVCYKPSAKRLQSFQRMLLDISKVRRVFMVRLPIDPLLKKREESYYPNFDTLMNELAIEYDVHYFDFTRDEMNFIFNDGTHMNRVSSIDFTRMLADSIKVNLN